MPKTAEPALTASSVTGTILAAASVLSVLGFHTFGNYLTTSAATLTAVIVGLVTLGAPLLAGLHIRARVAPIVGRIEQLEPVVGQFVDAVSEVSDQMDPEPDNDVDRPSPGPLVTGTRAPVQVDQPSAEKTTAKKVPAKKQAAKKAAKKTTTR